MKSVRRFNRLVLNLAGPATFEAKAGVDTTYTFPLFEEDQTTGELNAVDGFQIATLVATARRTPYASDFAFTWTLVSNPNSVYSEFTWNIAAADFDALTWQRGQLNQVIYVDFVATTNENDVNYTRSVEDADGNFTFPMKVSLLMSKVP